MKWISLKEKLKKYGIQLCFILAALVSAGSLPGCFVIFSTSSSFKTCIQTGVSCYQSDEFIAMQLQLQLEANQTNTSSHSTTVSECEIHCPSVKTLYFVFVAFVGVSLLCNAVYVMLKLLQRYNCIQHHKQLEGIVFMACFNAFVLGAIVLYVVLKFFWDVIKSIQANIRLFINERHMIENLRGHPSLKEVDIFSKNIAKTLFRSTWKKELTGQGRDAVGLSHGNINITHVFCVQTESLKERYNNRLGESEYSLDENVQENFRKNPIQTDATSKNTEIPEWKTQEQETLLFHGTARENVTTIIENGFDGKKNKRSPYGKGTYLSDSAQKADQYTDCPSARGQKNLTMFVVRVGLGKVVEEGSDVTCDTIVAGKTKLFREFVCKTVQLLFPQFLIVYERM